MIYSYLDTLLDKWVDWSEDFLSKKLTSNISDVNTILGTTGSDNPTRANEFYKIGILKLPLTGSNDAFDSLRKDNPVHSDFGYLSYLIRKAIKIDNTNHILNDGFKAISAISLIQQYVEYSNSEISLNFIVHYLLEKFPIPTGVDDKNFLRYLTAGMFCELNEDSNSFLNDIISNNTISLRIIEPKTKNVRIAFNNSNDIVNAITPSLRPYIRRKTGGETDAPHLAVLHSPQDGGNDGNINIGGNDLNNWGGWVWRNAYELRSYWMPILYWRSVELLRPGASNT